jgi:hypothetical protein
MSNIKIQKQFLLYSSIFILGVITITPLRVYSSPDISFDTLESDLSILSNFQTGEKPTVEELKAHKTTKKATFNKKESEKLGFNKKSIDTFEQLNDYNNELISDIDKNFSNKEFINKYPLVKTYFKEARLRQNKGIKTEVSYANTSINKSLFEVNTFADNSQNQCGTWGNPKPTSAKNWVTWNVNTNTTPYNWGYHNTASYVGTNDMTRTKTWNSGWCNYGSFRDHIIPKDIYKLIEQNYDGWSPNGEPNPEVFSYSWPYWNWPSYAQWWHNTY